MSDFPKLHIKVGGNNGLEIQAQLPEAFFCGEFTLRGDCPQSILIAPWMQFEPIKLMEFRQKMAFEIARRAECHESLVNEIDRLQKQIESLHKLMDRDHETQQMTYKMWREERHGYGLPTDFSDIKVWPPEMMSGYNRT